MKELKLIETKIEEIREKVYNEVPQEKIEEIQKEINSLLCYIRDKKDKWIEAIIDILCFLEEKIKIEKSRAIEEDKKKKLDEIDRKIFGMKEGIKREFLYNPQAVIDELKSNGQKIARENTFKKVADDINKIAFKLLEKVRLGQRDEVMYLLLRTFKADDKKLPISLIEALKTTKYDDSLFKSFIYAFLTPILGKELKQGGES